MTPHYNKCNNARNKQPMAKHCMNLVTCRNWCSKSEYNSRGLAIAFFINKLEYFLSVWTVLKKGSKYLPRSASHLCRFHCISNDYCMRNQSSWILLNHQWSVFLFLPHHTLACVRFLLFTMRGDGMSSDNSYVTPIHAIFFRILSKIKTNSSSLCLQPASFNFHLCNRYESLDRASFASEYLSDKTKLNCA